MDIDTAYISLQGNRVDNQDRTDMLVTDASVFLVVADGMGGHALGGEAAEAAVSTLLECYKRDYRDTRDPHEFLKMAFTEAHHQVTYLGRHLPPELKPGTTAVCCLVQDSQAWWGHVGDSRAYLIRNGRLVLRTRDHSTVELLLTKGAISNDEMRNHPQRNLLEYCLGGNNPPPPMGFTGPLALTEGDLMLLCTDGLWSQLNEKQLLKGISQHCDLQRALVRMASRACDGMAPYSDNVTGAALRWIGEDNPPPDDEV